MEVSDETVQDSRIIEGMEMDIVSHDVKKLFGLLLKKNGYVLEQLFSPLIVQTTPEHAELMAIAHNAGNRTGVVTKHHSHHYFGFAETQWELFLNKSPRRVKPLLYVYRVLLTGIHLSAHGRVDLVGKSFGVIKFSGRSGGQWDFSLARRDSKMSPGHKGFEIEFDHAIEPREAASRRNFTVNALMFDPRTREYLDFFGGREDLEKRVLRHTSPAFIEDPLRVLRGMQFAARFDLAPAPETVRLCQSIVNTFPELAVERVGLEWFKWSTAGQRPSAGLRFLKDNRGSRRNAAGSGLASGR